VAPLACVLENNRRRFDGCCHQFAYIELALEESLVTGGGFESWLVFEFTLNFYKVLWSWGFDRQNRGVGGRISGANESGA
jgi:hypothetical protein